MSLHLSIPGGRRLSVLAVAFAALAVLLPAYGALRAQTSASQGEISNPASSRARLHPRTSIPAMPVVKSFVAPHASPTVIVAHATDVSGINASISLTLDLGAPEVRAAHPQVDSVPDGVAFSALAWPKLATSALPDGVTLLSSRVLLPEHGAEPGTPEIPVVALTFVIPPDAQDLQAALDEVRTTPLGSITFAPVLLNSNGIARRIYTIRGAGMIPELTPSIRISPAFRAMRTATVRIPLVSSNGTMKVALTHFRVTLRLAASESLGSRIPTTDRYLDGIDRHLVANKWDIPRFASFAHGGTRGSGARTAGAKTGYGLEATRWIDRSAEYVKLTVSHDGLYRATASEIASAAFDLAQHHFTASNIRCISHGVEVPIWIDTDAVGNIAAIEFYGTHLHGFPLPASNASSERELPEWYNIYTDKNAYWLTTSSITGGTPKRFTPRLPDVALATTTVTSGTVALHHERDYFYYNGDASVYEEKSKQQTEYNDGERYEWFELHAPNIDPNHRGDTSRVTDTIVVTSLPPDAATRQAHFTFLSRGMSTNIMGNGVRHWVFARLNGENIGNDIFMDYNYDSLKADVPLSKFHIGINTVEVLSVGTIDSLDLFYFDHYDCRYDDGLTANADTGFAKGQWHFTATPSGPVYDLKPVSLDEVHLYNISDGTRVISQSGHYVDQPSASIPEYAGATLSSMLKCDDVTAWNAGAKGWSVLDTSQQIDYLVITHPDLLAQATRLAARRTAAGLRSSVVTTDEIFNAFDYGSDEPEALRRYLSYAYYHYRGTPVAMVTILGDASWDPKFNMNNVFHAAGDRSNQRSLVPTYGWPASDTYFTLVDSGQDLSSISSGMLISRIPVATAEEADAYLRKLVEYEDAAPADWNRRWLFIAGGAGDGQHAEFVNEAKTYMSKLALAPSAIDSQIIEGKDHSQTDPSQVGAIEDALRSGKGMMYFAGHGATWITDVVLPDPTELHNKGLYPLLITLSCRTGAFAEYNAVTLNESYLRQPAAGVVQAYGTAGFGEEGYDYVLSDKYFQLFRSASFDSTADSTHPNFINPTALLTAAKFFTSDAGYVPGFVSGNSRLQYCMLGDAAVGYALRPQPELAVHAPELRTSAADGIARTFFSVSDSVVTLSALIHNYGFSASRPVVVRVTDAGPNNFTLTYFDTIPTLRDTATIFTRLQLSSLSIGAHAVTVSVDPLHSFPESDTLDNTASILIQVNGLSATPFFPYEGARGFCDIDDKHAHLIVLLPQGLGAGDNLGIELDTSTAFTSPILTEERPAGTGYYTTLDLAIPAQPIPHSGVYWWRTRIHRATGELSEWQYASFSVASTGGSSLNYTSPEQLRSTILSGLAIDSGGALALRLQDTVLYEVISHGQKDTTLKSFPISQVYINGNSVVNYAMQGYLIIPLTADGSGIDTVYRYDLDYTRLGDTSYTDPIAAAMVSAIAGIPDGRRVIVLTNLQPFGPGITNDPSVTAAMQTLGSKNGIDVGYYGSYVLIGRKGLSPGTAVESIAPAASAGARAFDTVVTTGVSGVAETPFTAVAERYSTFTWRGSTPGAGADIRFTILGALRDGSGVDELDTVMASAGASTGTSIDLSKINARVYDKLAVRAEVTRSSNVGTSPTIFAIEIGYDAAPEFVATTDSITVLPSTVPEGARVVVHYGLTTLTCAGADSVRVPLIRQMGSRTDTVVYHTVAHLAGHDTVSFTDTISTGTGIGMASLMATINPSEAQNEQLLFNNTVYGRYWTTRDTTRPHGDIRLDGRHIPNFGYASKTAVISVDLVSHNALRDTLPASISAEIFPEAHPDQLVTVSAAQPGSYNVSFIPYATGDLQASLRIALPQGSVYSPGRWDVIGFVRDASGNTDTVYLFFTVSAQGGIEHVMNYPNPFKEQTAFTFQLLSDSSAEVSVYVYTITGRLIRTLTGTGLHAGLNWIDWDGRDEAGNDVGNGMYLYRLIMTGHNADGSSISQAVTQAAVRAK